MEEKMISDLKTKEKYGYETNSLAPTSNLPVWWKCEGDGCDEEREYSYAYCLKKELHAKETGGKQLCQKCSHAHRKGVATKKKVQGQSWLPLPPEVDISATQERYGYDPRDLPPWSRKYIIVKCYETGVVSEVKRCGINTSQSVKETGHYVSVGACTAKRRKGKKASEETKKAMAKSQQNRRIKENSKPTEQPTENIISPPPPELRMK